MTPRPGSSISDWAALQVRFQCLLTNAVEHGRIQRERVNGYLETVQSHSCQSAKRLDLSRELNGSMLLAPTWRVTVVPGSVACGSGWLVMTGWPKLVPSAARMIPVARRVGFVP